VSTFKVQLFFDELIRPINKIPFDKLINDQTPLFRSYLISLWVTLLQVLLSGQSSLCFCWHLELKSLTWLFYKLCEGSRFNSLLLTNFLCALRFRWIVHFNSNCYKDIPMILCFCLSHESKVGLENFLVVKNYFVHEWILFKAFLPLLSKLHLKLSFLLSHSFDEVRVG
jgi:hypothetical protein